MVKKFIAVTLTGYQVRRPVTDYNYLMKIKTRIIYDTICTIAIEKLNEITVL